MKNCLHLLKRGTKNYFELIYTHSIHYVNIKIYITFKNFLLKKNTTNNTALTGFSLKDGEMLRPALLFHLPVRSCLKRILLDVLLKQLQKGPLIPNDLGSSILSDCFTQDCN